MSTHYAVGDAFYSAGIGGAAPNASDAREGRGGTVGHKLVCI
jgi:hypothetical protein